MLKNFITQKGYDYLDKITHYFAINFDLSVNKLRNYYSTTAPQKAYKELSRYFLEHSFQHRQWSGYISTIPLSKFDLLDLTNNIHKEFPWLYICSSRFDATIIEDPYDLHILYSNL